METVQKAFSSFDLVQIFYFFISLSALCLLESSMMLAADRSIFYPVSHNSLLFLSPGSPKPWVPLEDYNGNRLAWRQS